LTSVIQIPLRPAICTHCPRRNGELLWFLCVPWTRTGYVCEEAESLVQMDLVFGRAQQLLRVEFSFVGLSRKP
jgi:hypothetical protein